MKRVLMIAYHYPPLQGSSGIQRTLKFSQYLPEFGWQPIVLGANPRAFPVRGNSQMREIPDCVTVHRPFAMDAARHFSIGGKYPLFLALPDRWASWWLGAVPEGLRLIRKYRPDVIWSTYPIATAHLIGLTLSRLSGIPWVADFRDPMTEDGYPANGIIRSVYRWVERHTVEGCAKAVLTTPGAERIYRERYAEFSADKFCHIANGYDEENFLDAAKTCESIERKSGPLTLIHSGIVYSSERDPTQFFSALSELSKTGKITAESFRIVLRATQNDTLLKKMIDEFGISDIVQLEPHIPYHAALSEMLSADGLLVLQASNCNHQIPAKLYEYLRAGRPILALTDPAGDTAMVLREAGIDTIAPLGAKTAIMEALLQFLDMLEKGIGPVANPVYVASCSRRSRTKVLSELLDQVILPPKNLV